ncbi:MAG: hypothetical protein K2K45_12420 [Muribaculaceae bacterium]|nr:hypothetical protein [Muribaculaceae bacterium]
MSLSIQPITIEECFASLKPYQRGIIEKLVAKYGEEGAAEQWITSQGPCQTSTFGGSPQEQSHAPSYWSRFKAEFDKFICGHPDYDKEREKFVSTSKPLGLAGVTGISTWLGPLIGMSPVLLVPAIALLLTATSKMGVKAYCATKSFE